MKYLPLFFDLHGQPVLLVGGGGIALRKARMLLRSGAAVSVVAPRIQPELERLLAAAQAHSDERAFVPYDLDGKRLVVAATDDGELNARISALCQNRGLPVNVVDQPDLCTVIFPSIIDRDPVTIAVSSGGTAPVLTRSLRAMLESIIPSAYGQLASFAARHRQAVKGVVADPQMRRRLWEKILHGPIAELVMSARQERAEELLAQTLQHPEQAVTGEVYLVGGGPGDPDLLTFKAHRLMQQADVVLFDRLVAPAIVDMCRADADRVYVGKRRDQHAVPQEQINTLLLRYAQQGKRVLRLKGGDPFVFGRGGEEIEQLARHGIPFQVVPGITAASGCACYAGIPLTHRDYAQSVRFVTGHLKDGSTNLNWSELVNSNETVVFYMGLVGLPVICDSLIAHGRAPATPIALVQQGTTERQRVIIGTLASIVDLVAARDVRAPTLLIVGDVVRLHETLRWYGSDEEV